LNLPKGLPSASALIENRVVQFFSIDTCVFQSNGYDFNGGALHALAMQRPSWLKIQLHEVVVREVMSHRMEPVLDASKKLDSIITKLQRLTRLNMNSVEDAIREINPTSVTQEHFEKELHDFVWRLNGAVLSIDAFDITKDLFDRYFLQNPPFSESKKHEFPDAASLLALEKYAEKHNVQGIIISSDKDWIQFADQSKKLYCVTSLEEFVLLFKSKGDIADEVRQQITKVLSIHTSELYRKLSFAIKDHVMTSSWSISQVYSNIGSVEAYVQSVECAKYDIDLHDISLWLVEHDPSLCTVELSATVFVKLEVELDFYHYDTIDHDEMLLGSNDIDYDEELHVRIFLMCKGYLQKESVESWAIDIEITQGDYNIDIGEVEYDFED
jgi:hypothetical protein